MEVRGNDRDGANAEADTQRRDEQRILDRVFRLAIGQNATVRYTVRLHQIGLHNLRLRRSDACNDR